MLRDRIAYRIVARLIASLAKRRPVCAVVSAPYGVTDALVELARAHRREGSSALVEKFEQLGLDGRSAELRAELDSGIAEADAGSVDRLLAFGEWASVAALGEQLDRLHVAAPILELGGRSGARPARATLVPGFYFRDGLGRVRCFPRGGGDISAVRVGLELGAAEVRFWKEQGGYVRDGVTLPEVESRDLLGWIGEEIRPIHPEAVRVARRHGLPLVLEDPYHRRPSTVVRHAGTRIPRAVSSSAERTPHDPVSSLSVRSRRPNI